ncbi:hypothetical protein PCURB6_38040 [Paenibacillus curdlanolyticus]|nr:hypothetical protein PCURB6_38040 [Paenibacillus curdlanolyticus]
MQLTTENRIIGYIVFHRYYNDRIYEIGWVYFIRIIIIVGMQRRRPKRYWITLSVQCEFIGLSQLASRTTRRPTG